MVVVVVMLVVTAASANDRSLQLVRNRKRQQRASLAVPIVAMPPWEVLRTKPPPPAHKPTTAAEKRKAHNNAEVDAILQDIAERVDAADRKRRGETWAGMPLAKDSKPPKITDEARKIAWAKHGLAPPNHRRRFDAYGNELT